MKESVAVAKEADTKKGVSPTKSDNSIQRVRDEPERQLGSLRDVLGNIRRDGGTPSVESIATHMSGMPSAQRAPALLALQQTHGNRYVQRVVFGIQAKLVVGQPGDIYEQEADRVADEVMRMPEPQVQRQLADESMQPKLKRTTEYFIQRQEEVEEILQTKNVEDTTPEVTYDIESQINTLRGGGKSLSKSERAFFEPRFGVDFGQVRVHTDARAAEAAREVNAQAFTLGQDVVFGAGEYSLCTTAGRRLLAHELTHVVQQRGAAALTAFSLTRNPEHEALGKNTEKIADDATGKQIGCVKEEGMDIPEVALPRLRSEHGLQRFEDEAEAEEAPDYPLAVAVQNGPPHQAINPGDHPDMPDSAGMGIAVTVIPRSGSRDCLDLIEDKEQVSDSFDHRGSFQHLDSIHFHGSEWQEAGRIPPDKHALPISLIIDRADRHDGEGGFAYHQLDIYKIRGSPRKYVIPYSGYRVVFNIVTGPGGRIELDIQKMPEGCTVADDEGRFMTGEGHDDSGGLNPRYSDRAVVRAAGAEELRPTGPTHTRSFGQGQRDAVSESHTPFIAHRGIPDAGVVEDVPRAAGPRDASLPGEVESPEPTPAPAQASFSHTDAVAYALQWALGTNPRFPRFAGDDCTNFVSQAMFAGGWTMIGGSFSDRVQDNVWWHGRSRVPGVRASYTWAGARNFANFCSVSGRATRVSDPMRLNPGDVLQLEHGGHIGHSMVVSGKTDADLLLSYHTRDCLNEPLSTIRANDNRVVFVPWSIL